MSIDPPSPWIQCLITVVVLALAGCAQARRVECGVDMVPINAPAPAEEFDLPDKADRLPTPRSEHSP